MITIAIIAAIASKNVSLEIILDFFGAIIAGPLGPIVLAFGLFALELDLFTAFFLAGALLGAFFLELDFLADLFLVAAFFLVVFFLVELFFLVVFLFAILLYPLF